MPFVVFFQHVHLSVLYKRRLKLDMISYIFHLLEGIIAEIKVRANSSAESAIKASLSLKFISQILLNF